MPKPSDAYIKEQAKIFGRNPSRPVELTKYQVRMNEVAQELCLTNPNLLSDRNLLLQKAQERVHDQGYVYKKGKSRSKRLNSPDQVSIDATPKRKKICQEFRLQRIAELKDVVKDLSDQITYKEKRRESASNVHNYKECDMLTEQMSALKAECREHERELVDLQRKQRKSHNYYQKRREKASSTPVRTPTPTSGSTLTTPSPRPLAFPPLTPSSRASWSPRSSESEFSFIQSPSQIQAAEHSGDTVIITSDEEGLAAPGHSGQHFR